MRTESLSPKVTKKEKQSDRRGKKAKRRERGWWGEEERDGERERRRGERRRNGVRGKGECWVLRIALLAWEDSSADKVLASQM